MNFFLGLELLRLMLHLHVRLHLAEVLRVLSIGSCLGKKLELTNFEADVVWIAILSRLICLTHLFLLFLFLALPIELGLNLFRFV